MILVVVTQSSISLLLRMNCAQFSALKRASFAFDEICNLHKTRLLLLQCLLLLKWYTRRTE